MGTSFGPKVPLPGNVSVTLRTEVEANNSTLHHGSVLLAVTEVVARSPSIALAIELAADCLSWWYMDVTFWFGRHIVDPSRPHTRTRFLGEPTVLQSVAESLPAGELVPAGQSLHAEAPAAAYVPAHVEPSQQRHGGKAEPEGQVRGSAKGRGQARALSSLVSGERLAGARRAVMQS